jgi:hypothetical protein
VDENRPALAGPCLPLEDEDDSGPAFVPSFGLVLHEMLTGSPQALCSHRGSFERLITPQLHRRTRRMKLKALVCVGTLALAGASAAVAAPPAGKGKPPATGAGCKPKVSVILSGKLAADAGSAPTSLSVNVTGGNRFARAWKNQNGVSIALGSSTKVSRQGDRNAADLKSGDRVVIRAASCRADLAGNAMPSLTASRVTAHPAAA